MRCRWPRWSRLSLCACSWTPVMGDRCRSSRCSARSRRLPGWAATGRGRRRGAGVPRLRLPLHPAARAASASRKSGPSSACVAYLFTCSLIIGIGEAMRTRAGARQRARRAAAGHAAQHRRRGHHHRRRRPRHLPERGGRVADRLDAAGGRRPAARRRISHRQRGHAPAGREPGGRALREGVVVGLANHTVLIRQGRRRAADRRQRRADHATSTATSRAAC